MNDAMPQNDTPCLRVNDLARMPYAHALDYQRRMHEQVLGGAAPMTVLLVEHDPVITVSRRRSASQHLLVPPAQLAELGIDLQPTDRGGDITYHGPGQLVAYPILRLGLLRFNIGRYVHWLEQIIIDTVAHFGIEARRDRCARGVWVAQPYEAKLCAVGVRVRKNVTMHGLALNISTNLDHFNTIIPCGLRGRRVVSLKKLLADRVPTMAQVKHALIETMCNEFNRRIHVVGRNQPS